MSVSLRRQRSLLATYLSPQRRGATLLAVLLLANIALQLIGPQVMAAFIDATQRAASQRSLTLMALLFIGISLVQRVVALAVVYMGETVGWKATNALRADLARHCLRLGMAFHKSRTPGEMIERIDGDVTALATFFSRFTVNVLGNGLLVVGILIILLATDLWLGAGLALYAVLTVLALRLFHRLTVRKYAASRQASAEQYGFIEERISGTEDIRASGAEEYVMHGLYRRMRAMLRTERAARLAGNLTSFSTNFLFVMGYAVGLGLGAYLYIHGQISIGTAYVVVFYIGMLFSPIDNIRKEVQGLQQALAGIGRIDALLDTPIEVREQVRTTLPAGPLSVEMEHVSFRYEDEPLILRDISFRLEPGRVLGLLGRTGSGKTTLTRLLTRLCDPETGCIQAGGVDVRDIALSDLRRRVSMVTQDVQLFKASVRDNLTFFDWHIPDEHILLALREIGLDRWVDALPSGLDTVLGTGGEGLSAGEAQLLALGRAYLREPGLVILDEASSRLDPATERLLQGAMDRLLEGRTGIVIAHRLETVRRVDDIMVLEAGRIVEWGPRLKLAAQPTSRFARLLLAGRGLSEGTYAQTVDGSYAGLSSMRDQ